MQKYNGTDNCRLVANMGRRLKVHDLGADQTITPGILFQRSTIVKSRLPSVLGARRLHRFSLLDRIPDGHSTWDVMRVRAFKASIIHGRKVASGPRSKLEAIRSAITSIRSF